MNRLEELLLLWQDQSISEQEAAELKQLLAEPDARAYLAKDIFMTGVIVEALRTQKAAKEIMTPAREAVIHSRRSSQRFSRVAWSVGIAASLLVAVGFMSYQYWPRPVEPVPISAFAQFEQVQGETFVVSKEHRLRAQVGQVLIPGQGIATGVDSEAIVKLEDDIRLTLSGDTMVYTSDEAEQSNGSGRLVLEQGDLLVEMSSPMSRKMSVETPIGVAVAGDEHTSLQVHDATGVVVMKGHVNFIHKATGKTIRITRGHYLAASQEGELYSAQLFTGDANVWATVPYAGPQIPSISFSPDGELLATGYRSERCGVQLGPVNGKEWPTTLHGDQGAVFSPDGKLLATSDRANVLIYEVSTSKVVRKIPNKLWSMRAICLAFSPDGNTLAVARVRSNEPGLVDLYDLSADMPRATLRGHPLGITSLAFSPDGKTLATGSYDKTVVLWNVATGKRQTRIPMLSGLVVWALAYAPDGETLAIATGPRDFRYRVPGEVNLWDPAAMTVRRTLRGHTRAVTSLSYSANGQTLVTASADTTVRFWDPSTGRQHGMLKGHKAATGFESLAAALSPDGAWLATASRDRTVKVWQTTWIQKDINLGLTAQASPRRTLPDWVCLSSHYGKKMVTFRSVREQ